MADQLTRNKLGKLPAKPGAVKGRFTDYFDIAKLAEPPRKFGHDKMVAGGFPMLCNNIIGDCAIAGALHQTQLWNAEAGVAIPVTDKTAVQNYSAITGYVQGPEITGFDGDGNAIIDPEAPENPTDQGTAVPSLLKYWYTNGIVDAAGRPHLIGAAIPLEPGNWEQFWYASFYADGVTIGLELDEEWQTAFQEGKPWLGRRRRNVEGGHYIVGVAWDGDDDIAPCATWGGYGLLGKTGYEQGSDETYALLSKDRLRNGVDVNGLNWDQLVADLPMLQDIDDAPEPELDSGASAAEVGGE
jgi:hypothetical protein